MVFKGALTAALLAGTTIVGTAPAQADRGSGAVVAGIAGLAIGAAIASDHRGYYDAPAYYVPQPVYYGGYDYGRPYGYGYGYGYRGDYGYRGREGWGDRGWRRDDHDRGDRHDHRDWDRGGRDR